jgi:plastocyanin
MTRITALFVAAILALALAASTAAMGTATKLNGTVGPGFTITLKKGSTKVSKLPHGRYTIVVRDRSRIHNFRLKGPGLNKEITKVAFVGTKQVTVTLKKGAKYTYVCDPHKAIMRGSFRVT